MMKYRLYLSLVFLLLWGCSSNETGNPPPETADSLAEDTVAEGDALDFSAAGLEEDEVRVFLTKLQQAVARSDRRAVASMVSFPLHVNINGEELTLRTVSDFVAHYDQVMNDYVRTAVQEETVDNLFVNWQGVRVGRGALWFGGVSEGEASQTYAIKIIAVNPEPI